MAVENIIDKGKNAGNHHFLLFSQCFQPFNSSPKDKNEALFKFKAFAVDKINVTQKLKLPLGRAENIVRKGENALTTSPLLQI